MNMLHQFTFKNFKSFKEEATLDLLATSIKEHASDVVTDVCDEQVLKVAAIYGANASGKSNVLDAFQIMRSLVMHSFSQGEETNKLAPEPFWFSASSEPVMFSVIFSIKNNIYQYGFSCLHNKIKEEYLYKRDQSVKKESYIELFERKENQISGAILEVIAANTIFELIEEDTLLVSVISKLKINFIQDVYQWFKNTIVVDYGNPSNEVDNLFQLQGTMKSNPLISLIENRQEKKQLENFLQAIDVGIQGVSVIQADDSKVYPSAGRFGGGKQIVSLHNNPKTKEPLMVPISNESSGTLKMLMLYVDLKRVMEVGGTIFIDEMDAKLHPLLIRYIIIIFHDEALNPKQAQLVFSTQEVFTLDKENLRRDEIWFTDKNEEGESELYSLASYVDDESKKIRNDASYGKDYILGKYKSIPSLKRLGEFYEEKGREKAIEKNEGS